MQAAVHHQVLITGELMRVLQTGVYNGAGCGSQVYNPDIKICCAGQLSNRVLGDNLFCGTTPYGVEDRGVLCCNQTLHRGVEAGHQCSPGGHLYLPSRDMVCESRVHLDDPGKHCCGEETYDPQDEICCNGLKPVVPGPRADSISHETPPPPLDIE
ncbi:galaxin-like [Salvelinus alpinus]|uniref:galaxin-like n=1 Tax=Salvelinus alpinus TaxID=8036 RepID=UPI0039FBB4FA